MRSVLGDSISISPAQLVTLTNIERQKYGLSLLTENGLLDSAAQNKSNDMFAKNYWAHIAPDGTTPWFFIKQAGYDYVYAGENLAKGFYSSQDVVNAWMNSPTHRANVLSENFQDVGFSVAEGSLNGEQTILVVEEFGGKNLVPITSGNAGEPKPQEAEEVKQVEQPKEVIQTEAPKKVEPVQVLAAPKVQSINFSQRIVLIVLVCLLAIVTMDMIFAQKRKVVRISGHNLDHILLFVFIIVLLAILFKGAVL
jgi:hypothetical protein